VPSDPRPSLSRHRILEAAGEQVDAEGLGSLSSRSLAARLGVTPMALYRHVADMDEIVGSVVDQLLEGLALPDSRLDWRAWLEELAQGFRMLLRQEPEALALFTRRPVTTPAARHRLAGAHAQLTEAGFDGDQAQRAYAAVHTYTIGFSALEHGRSQTPAPGAELDAPDDPVSAAIRGFVTEDQFLHGLRALIAGLAPDREAP